MIVAVLIRGRSGGHCRTWLWGLLCSTKKTAADRIGRLRRTAAARRVIYAVSLTEPVDVLLEGDGASGNIDWVVCGGGDDPVHPEWVRGVRDRCKERNIPFRFAGWGAWVPEGQSVRPGGALLMPEKGEAHHFRDDAGAIAVTTRRVYGAAPPPLLDGLRHDECPAWAR